MRFLRLLWLGLFPLLTASAVSRVEWASEPSVGVEHRAIRSGPDGDAPAVRQEPGMALRIIARAKDPRGPAGPAPAELPSRSQRITTPEVRSTPVRLATLDSSWATAAHGGPLIIYPTAPPLHG
jgi:hypothetical protein